MSKKSRQRIPLNQYRISSPRIPIKELTYAEALNAIRIIRPSTLVLTDLSIEHPPHPELPVSPITQAKIIAVTHLMETIGRSPGDFPITKFDKPITFRKLEKETLDWLEVCGVPARRNFAPFGATNYIWLFASKDRLPVLEDDIERFFSRLIHCLLIEVQILITKQYYYGLGFYQKGSNLSRLDEWLTLPELAKSLPRKSAREITFDTFNTVALDELHGKIFLEYCAVMVRAQWDKLTRLICLFLGIKPNWVHISEGLTLLNKRITNNENLTSWCNKHLQLYYEISHNRLVDDGWIKKFRDPLLHDVGQHTAGVMPHETSLETTSEMWDKVCDEHNWIREAMMSALVAFASSKNPSPERPKLTLHSGIALIKPNEKDAI